MAQSLKLNLSVRSALALSTSCDHAAPNWLPTCRSAPSNLAALNRRCGRYATSALSGNCLATISQAASRLWPLQLQISATNIYSRRVNGGSSGKFMGLDLEMLRDLFVKLKLMRPARIV